MNTGIAEFDVTLCDGRAVHLRSLRESDEAELVQAFERMSPDERYMRFMRAVREPNLERVRKTLASFPGSGIGIVATVPADDGIDIVGSTIFVVGSNEASCEFAINVASDFGGVGLATILLTALIDAAKARGLTEMEGFVLAANQPMLRLAHRLGFSVTADPDDRSVRACRLQLTDAQNTIAAT